MGAAGPAGPPRRPYDLERSQPRRGRNRCQPEHIGQHRHTPEIREPDTTAENRHNTISNQPRPSPESPRSVTNAITRLEHRGLVERRLSPDDRRVVLATITPDGQALVHEATKALNQASFSLPGLSQDQTAEITSVLRGLRIAAGDITLAGPRTSA